jgi:tetratricopeptide (TPR) repeat protein
MKAFMLLFAILMMTHAAPAMACVFDQTDHLPEKYREHVRTFADKTVQELGSQDTPDARLKLAEALYAAANRRVPHCGRTFPGEEIAFYDEIERRFGRDKSPKMRVIVFKALIAAMNLAFLYDEHVSRGNDAARLMERRYATDSDPEIQALYAGALVSKVDLEHGYRSRSPLSDKKREQFISLYDEILARYRSSKNPGVRAAVARALINKARIMRDKERLSVYDEIIWRSGEDDIPEIRKEVINALLEKGEVLQSLGRYGEAVSHYDNFMRFPWLGNELAPSRHEISYAGGRGPLLALILEKKGEALKKQGKLSQAAATYDQAILVYDDAVSRGWKTDEELLNLVFRALIAKAAILRKQKGGQAANAVYENIVERVEKSKNKLDGRGKTRSYFVRSLQLSICGVSSMSDSSFRDACIYVFQRIGLDDHDIQRIIQGDIQRAIKSKARQKSGAQQKP